MLRIITVAYGNPLKIRRLIESLKTHVKIPAEIVVWDNTCPPLNELSTFETGGIPVTVVAHNENVGFSRAVNHAAQLNTGRAWDGMLLVNPDAWLDTDLNVEVATKLERLGGLVGLRVFDDEAKTQRQASARAFPSWMTTVANREGILTRLMPKNRWSRGYLHQDLDTVEGVETVDWVSGCALYANRETWEKLGGYDERYFLYVEDVDLGRTAKAKAIPVFYFPEVDFIHLSRSSASQRPLFSDYHHHRGMAIYHWKWSGFFGRLFSPIIFAGIFARFLLRRCLGGSARVRERHHSAVYL